MKFCPQARVELTRTAWPTMNTADSPTQVWALLLQLTSYPWDFGDFRKCRSPCLFLELYLLLVYFPARFGPFNRPGCLLYTYLHSTAKVMYSLTFHRLLLSILNVFLPRKTKTIQKKAIWSFLKHFTLILYLSKVTKTIFPQSIFDVKFPALFKSASKNRGSHLRKWSYLHLTVKIDLKVKIDGTVKCPPRS